ncbi:porin family protein [Caballeronia sp. LP006]|uniref:porin family protein n=1 Tax=Caballeronia sp. LP006 TaxID=3038552 RepID=UPI00285E6651|nr:porin family protein [Caballeronia sp. LP006]MDR5831565.1 porin family protein [Caballeronia sp. LP006]
MVSIKKVAAPLFVSLLGIASAHASEFSGPFVGAKLGLNFSDATGHDFEESTHTTFFPGLTAGYNVDVNQFVVGVEGFADLHAGSTTKKDGGIDVKVGMPIDGNIMPYARVGFTGTWPDTRLHYGAGVEYKFAKQWSVAGEYTADTAHFDGGHRRNDSLTVGVHYYF